MDANEARQYTELDTKTLTKKSLANVFGQIKRSGKDGSFACFVNSQRFCDNQIEYLVSLGYQVQTYAGLPRSDGLRVYDFIKIMWHDTCEPKHTKDL